MRRGAPNARETTSPVTRIAFYPGTFDPVTNGHVDIFEGALAIADAVVVGVGINAGKSPMFALEERLAMVRDMIASLDGSTDPRARAIAFDGLAVDAARKAGASMLIRGLRDASDFDYEMQMSGMNCTMAPGLRTVFLPASPKARHITATLVRQIASMGGDVSAFVPTSVAQRIEQKFSATE
jgi:pantetheine-phosphate adenylyltransferase